VALVHPIKESIAYMYEEERLAHDLYLAIYNRQPVTQLQRIATRSEVRHIDAVASLANKYRVALPSAPAGRYSKIHFISSVLLWIKAFYQVKGLLRFLKRELPS